MSDSLRNKTIKGTAWSAADAFLGQGVTFMVGIVLARILTPAEYGLIGIVLIFTTVLSGVVDSGFSSALIRKKDVTDIDYNTMFITNMVISLLMFTLLWFCSPMIALFFQRSELTKIVRVMGLILIFQALSITQVTILTKRIDFKTKTKASVVAAIVSGMVGICMAYMGKGVWSLVGQLLSNKLFYSVSLWGFNRWWPKAIFNKDSFRYMWGFGWKIMLSGLLNNIWNQLSQVVVGKCYSPNTLGQYTRSKEYSMIFSENFTKIIQRVTYPVLAELQDEKERMVAAYRRIIKISMFISAICMITLGAVAEPLIFCLIGPQWHEAATYLPLICVSMSLYPLHAINLNMLQVQGRSDIYILLEIVKKFVAFIPLLLGIVVNIKWMLLGHIFTGIIFFFLNSYYTGKKLGYSSWLQIKDVAPSYGIAIVVAFSVYFFKYLPITYWGVLPLQVLFAISVFLLLCNYSKMGEYKEFMSIAKDYLQKMKHKSLK